MGALEVLKTEISARFPAAKVAACDYSKRGQHIEVEIAGAEIISVAQLLLAHSCFLEFGTVVDLLDSFQVVYQFGRYSEVVRIVVKYSLPKGTEPASIALACPAADWFEREVFDMFGLKFAGHPDMRHLLMPEESTFYPLLKTAPAKEKSGKRQAKEGA